MPEELAVILILLVGLLWLLAKVFQAIATALDEATSAYGDAAKERKQKRFFDKKARLSEHVRIAIPASLDSAEQQLKVAEIDFTNFRAATAWIAHAPNWARVEFKEYVKPAQSSASQEMNAEDIRSILTTNQETWSERESAILGESCVYPPQPPSSIFRQFQEFPILDLAPEDAEFEYESSNVTKEKITKYFKGEQDRVRNHNNRKGYLMSQCELLNQQIQEWNGKSRLEWEAYVEQTKFLWEKEVGKFKSASEVYVRKCEAQKTHFRTILNGYAHGEKNAVTERIDYILENIPLPSSVPRMWNVDFDEDQRILVVEMCLPDVIHRPPFKTVALKSGLAKKPLNQTERKEIIPRVHPAILLRTAHEVFRHDDAEIINLLVLNGWVTFDDPSTGINTQAYTASLMVEREQISALNLAKVDPLVAFEGLHGKSAGRLIEIIPIEPTLSLNKRDSRFVNAKDVLSTLGNATNLAAMDWQDFEHLIRELFAKEFAGRGAEVKITQASRDRGVDAVAFDPDPIRGGKFVIQAKRYTNTVDVSAVRDLCAVVKKEGASRGILVTTSTYGSDAYAFANNEPVTLLNGAELLGLLKKHGYTFRINLQEARALHRDQNPERPR